MQAEERLPKCDEIGCWLQVSGTVVRTTLPKTIESAKEFRCRRCDHRFEVEGDPEQQYQVTVPTACPGELGCNASTFDEVGCIRRDFQEIKVQEEIQRLAVGSLPRSISIVLLDDLVDVCKAGDQVQVVGVVRKRWDYLNVGQKCELELFMMGTSIVVHNEQAFGVDLGEDIREEFEEFWRIHSARPFAGRNTILSSICPNLFGLAVVKLATALLLIGGVERHEQGTHIRGESHVLLVGEPVHSYSLSTTGHGKISVSEICIKDGHSLHPHNRGWNDYRWFNGGGHQGQGW